MRFFGGPQRPPLAFPGVFGGLLWGLPWEVPSMKTHEFGLDPGVSRRFSAPLPAFFGGAPGGRFRRFPAARFGGPSPSEWVSGGVFSLQACKVLNMHQLPSLCECASQVHHPHVYTLRCVAMKKVQHGGATICVLYFAPKCWGMPQTPLHHKRCTTDWARLAGCAGRRG